MFSDVASVVHRIIDVVGGHGDKRDLKMASAIFDRLAQLAFVGRCVVCVGNILSSRLAEKSSGCY